MGALKAFFFSRRAQAYLATLLFAAALVRIVYRFTDARNLSNHQLAPQTSAPTVLWRRLPCHLVNTS